MAAANTLVCHACAGVHFVDSTKAARKLCEPIGRAAYARGRALIEGTNTGPVDIADYY